MVINYLMLYSTELAMSSKNCDNRGSCGQSFLLYMHGRCWREGGGGDGGSNSPYFIKGIQYHYLLLHFFELKYFKKYYIIEKLFLEPCVPEIVLSVRDIINQVMQ